MRIGGRERNVVSRERAGDVALNVGGSHRAVAKILHAGSPCAMVVDAHAVAGAHKIAIANIAHIVERNLLLHFRTQQRRVLLREVHIVVDERDVVPAKTINMA